MIKKQKVVNLLCSILLLITTITVKGQDTFEFTPNNSNSRTININAPEGSLYQKYNRGVCIFIDDEYGLSTGSLVNTANQYGKYYILTSAHSVDDFDEDEFFEAYFSFNYEALSPSNRTEQGDSLLGYELGAVVKLIDQENDLALIEIEAEEVESLDVFSNLYFTV